MTLVTALAGLLFGLIGTTLGILNYRRDRPKLHIALNWDAVTLFDKEGKQSRLGQIYITNSGRRPIYIVAAGIEFDSPYSAYREHRTTQGSVKGRRLAEDDPPLLLAFP